MQARVSSSVFLVSGLGLGLRLSGFGQASRGLWVVWHVVVSFVPENPKPLNPKPQSLQGRLLRDPH